MQFIRIIFGLRTIYFKQTWQQITYLTLAASLVLLLVLSSINRAPFEALTITAPVIIIGLYLLTRTIVRTIVANRYIDQYVAAPVVNLLPSSVAVTSINLQLNEADRLMPIAVGNNFQAFLATFNFYVHTKAGSYVSKEVYYTVLQVNLDRTLPHILFDSKTARGRQFKQLYLNSQRLSVQGPFDDVFDTYAPQTYAIDTLSFVTPEVMEALIAAKAYDIELFGNTLSLYAPLLDSQEMATLLAHGQSIAIELNDNIDTYRDNRLTGNDRRTQVTAFGRALLRSPRKYIIWASVFAVPIIGLLILAIQADNGARDEILFNQFSLLIYILFLSNVGRVVAIIRENHKAEERYRTLYQTNRGQSF